MSRATDRRAAVTAMLDQAHAASGHAVGALHALAEAKGGQVREVRTTPATQALTARYRAGIAGVVKAGRSPACAHLSVRAPAVAFWVAHVPERLWCAACLPHARLPAGDPEDRRCDVCGHVEPESIWPISFVLPPVVLDVSGAPVVATPAVVICAGLCDRCHAAEPLPPRSEGP